MDSFHFIQADMARATDFVEHAAEQGAQLILLPELMPTGYRLTKDLWDAAEPKNGPTAKWFQQHARRLGI